MTCGELPNPELVISELSKDMKSIKVIAKAKDELMNGSECGYTCLAQNPMDNEKFASSSQVIDDSDTGINLWELNTESWKNGQADYSVITAQGKRARTDIARIAPTASLKCQNGIQSMHWATSSTLIAGTIDHQLKVFDLEKL